MTRDEARAFLSGILWDLRGGNLDRGQEINGHHLLAVLTLLLADDAIHTRVPNVFAEDDDKTLASIREAGRKLREFHASLDAKRLSDEDPSEAA